MTKPLTPRNRRKFIAKARDHLNCMRVALIRELASGFRAVHSGGDDSSLDSADLASKELEEYLTVILSERERNRIIEIDHALGRMDEANHGLCEACGLEIAEPRLKAMPFTRHCRDCQQDREREAKTRYRSDDIAQERFIEFGSKPAEDEINQQPK